MRTLKQVYYCEDNTYIGCLEEFPDYRTQGTDLEELEKNKGQKGRKRHKGKMPVDS